MGVFKKVISKFFLSVIWVYQKAISPLTPASCRYTPTCSGYAKEAILLHGPYKGSVMGAKRICRCHPFHAGGYDPVPGSEEYKAHLRHLEEAKAQA